MNTTNTKLTVDIIDSFSEFLTPEHSETKLYKMSEMERGNLFESFYSEYCDSLLVDTETTPKITILVNFSLELLAAFAAVKGYASTETKSKRYTFKTVFTALERPLKVTVMGRYKRFTKDETGKISFEDVIPNGGYSEYESGRVVILSDLIFHTKNKSKRKKELN
jgi:hypothetical protein